MPEHIADSQPRHHDAGMDAFIRHMEGTPDGALADPGEGEEEAQPLAAEEAEATEVEVEEPEAQTEEIEAEAEEVEVDDEEDPLVPIMVNGVEEQVPFSELTKGYQRQADYTRKTQALAEERKTIEAERARLEAEHRVAIEQAAQLAQQMQMQLQANTASQAEMEQLRLTNPGEYAARKEEERQKMMLIAQAQQQQAQLEQQQTAQRIQQERQSLIDSEPDFANDFEGTYAALGRWVTSPEGGKVSPEEWNREYDHRRILIAYRAWKASEQAAAATDRNSSVRKKVAKLPRVRPVARQDPGQAAKANAAAAVERMQSTNSNRDIAAALQAHMAATKRGANDGYP